MAPMARPAAKAGALAYTVSRQRLEPSLTPSAGKGWSLRLLKSRLRRLSVVFTFSGQERIVSAFLFLRRQIAAQVSFNMLSQYGSDSPHSLEEIELKIDRHLATLLAGANALTMPSLRLIQAPVFHGYSMSVWVEFEDNPGRNAILQALNSPKIDLRAHDEEPPTNAGVAGQSGITIGAIAPDRNHPRAHWFWMVADNLRITAENALEVARVFLK